MTVPEPHPGIQKFAALTAAMVIVLILVGGLVTTTRTGDTIDTWPHWRGALKGGAWVEMSHRAVAVVVGLMVAGLAFWLQFREPRAWVRRLGWIALAAVVVQALIGAVRVGRFYPAATAIVHATFAQAVFCALVATALFVSRAWNEKKPVSGVRNLGIAATAAAFVQLVAGAVTRHTGMGLEVHIVGAVAVLLLGSVLGSRVMMTPLRNLGYTLLGVLGAQIALGIATLVLTRSDAFTRSIEAPVGSLLVVSAHVALGAVLLAACLILTLQECNVSASHKRCIEEGRKA